MFDGKAFGREIVTAVKEHVSGALAPLVARLDALERRFDDIPAPKDGKDANPEDTASIVIERLRGELGALRTDLDTLSKRPEPNVPQTVTDVLAKLPQPLSITDVKGAIEQHTEARFLEVQSAIRELEKRDLLPLITERIDEAIQKIPPPLSLATVQEIVNDSLVSALSGLPTKDGIAAEVLERVRAEINESTEVLKATFVHRGNLDAKIKSIVNEQISGMPLPQDGKDAEPDEVASIVIRRLEGHLSAVWQALENVKAEQLSDLRTAIDQAISELPKPKDGEPGKSVTVEDVRPLVEQEVSKAIAALPPPEKGKDGIGLAGALIDRDGNLVLTLSDGKLCELGRVVGKDGEPGRDGFGLDEFDASLLEDGRTVVLSFARGDIEERYELHFPVVIDRGVFKDGASYLVGDGVTWGGSYWIAQKNTEAKPGENRDWRLAVKRGRDGKDGVVKAQAPVAPIRVRAPAEAN